MQRVRRGIFGQSQKTTFSPEYRQNWVGMRGNRSCGRWTGDKKHDRLVFLCCCCFFLWRYCLCVSLCVSSRHIQNCCDSLVTVASLSVRAEIWISADGVARAAAAVASASRTLRHPAAGRGGGGGQKKKEGNNDDDLAARVGVAIDVDSVTPGDLFYKQWWLIAN